MSQKLHVYLKTYGCQMNVHDSLKMLELLKPFGYEVTENPAEADISILNTCHIREKAEQKVYSDLGRLHIHQQDRKAAGKEMLIAVGGCVGQAEGKEIIKNAPFVSMVFGPQTYHRLPEMLAKIVRKADDKANNKRRGIIVDTDFPTENKFDFLPKPTSSTSSVFLSVQEGCDKFCTFCVVPYTRGAEFSRSVAAILEEAKQLIELGAKEITLLGQNVNAYHGEAPSLSSHGTGEWGLGRLIQALGSLNGLERIRYTTSHPRDMDDDLIQAHAEIPQLMPFLHLPIQSGSDRILTSMNRQHTNSDYLKIIDKLRNAREDIAFSSDFISGFPGETEEDHQETLKLIQTVGYAQAYSFRYSIRPGTPAGLMDLQVPEAVKNRRLQELQELITTLQLHFNQRKIGSVQKILLERPGKHPAQMIGKTPYMQSTHITGNQRLLGQFADVIIRSATASSLGAEIITDEFTHMSPSSALSIA